VTTAAREDADLEGKERGRFVADRPLPSSAYEQRSATPEVGQWLCTYVDDLTVRTLRHSHWPERCE
jgi:hypothetical protein